MGLMMLLTATPAAAQLKQGDTITVSYTTGGKTYYVARSGNTNNLMVVQGTPTKDCLWVLATMKGQPSNTGKENAAVVTARNVSAMEAGANSYFYLPAQSKGAPKLVAQASASQVYTNKSSQAINNYIEANVYIKGGRTNYYLYYNNSWQANTSNKQTYRIQKWIPVTERTYRPEFLPSDVVFDYAAKDAAAASQAIHVTCQVTKREAKYYYNVSNADVRIVEQAPTTTTAESADASIDWVHSVETQMEISNKLYDSGTKTWSFTLTPQGASPIQEEKTITEQNPLENHINWIRFSKTYSDGRVEDNMQCTRRAYMHRVLDPLDFTVTHSNYTFPISGGSMSLEPFLYVQHGEEWVNSDGIAEARNVQTMYYYDRNDEGTATSALKSADRYRVVYGDSHVLVPGEDRNALQVTISDGLPSWLTFNGFTQWGINFTATDNNEGDEPRSATVMIRVDYVHVVLDASGNDTGERVRGTFIRQVILRQPGKNAGAAIQFHHKGSTIPSGAGAGQQAVHTSKQIRYYIPGDKAGRADGYGSEVELRPVQMSFYGYRRWYNFDNGKGPQFGAESDKTIWANAPSVKSGTTTYNYTPINTDDAHSYGVFAINGSSSGFRILRDGQTEGVPVIRGLKTATGGPKGDGVHTIACDLSCFTDYSTVPDKCTDIAQLKEFTEPTLSYRMLFELHPATEVADKFAALQNGEYLENYEYTAPTGVNVHLATSQRFRNTRYHESELGYFYYTNPTGKTGLTRLKANNNIVWKQKIGNGVENTFTPSYASNTDNAIVSNRTAGTVVYTLTVGGHRIAKFTVHYMSPTEVGPSSVALLTNSEITKRYQLLNKIDWDTLPGKSSSKNTIAAHHLDWADATFGYAYQKEKVASNRPTNKDLCYYGEYLLLNNWSPSSDYSWMDKSINNHSGLANGFMLFADGTLEPSMVASINTSTTICSGQQMYCSAWVANACPTGGGTGANPIFRFNVQGRNSESEEWQDVEVFFAGELPKGSGWRQILFPINSNQSFTHTRVCVYNFATDNTGNDFFLDDIYLFATPLPISAYQASSACSGEDIVIIVKVDYQNMADEHVNQDVYYQGWGETTIDDQKTFVAIPDLASYGGYYMYNSGTNYEIKSRYEADHSGSGLHKQDMGRLRIPDKTFKPKDADVYLSVQQFIDELHDIDTIGQPESVKRTSRAGLFYIQEPDGKYAMYLAHLLKAHEGGHYEIRFAQDPADLDAPACAMSVHLDIYKQTKLTTGDGATATGQPILNSCPNIDDEIKVVVTNTMIGENIVNETQTALGRADWIMGIAADTIYGAAYAATGSMKYGKPKNGKSIPATRADSLKFWKDSADVLFQKYYGYDRHEVYSAFAYDLRRVPDVNQPNDNYEVSDYTRLDPNAFLDPHNYQIVKSLCENGLVNLNVGTRSVMLNAGDSLFLWVYPIAGSATFEGQMLMVCNAAQWVDYRAPKPTQDKSSQIFNPSPIANKDKTPAQKLMTPSTRVTASMANKEFRVKVMDIQNAYLAWDSLRVIGTDDPALSPKIAQYEAAYNAWYNHTGSDQRPAFPNPATFSMRYYSDKVAQSTNTVKYYQEDGHTPNPAYHSDTKDGASWHPYQEGDTIIFRPIDAAHVAYLQDRRTRSEGAQVTTDGVTHYSVYSQTDADWIAKGNQQGNLQPGFQYVNTGDAQMRANYTYHMFTHLVTSDFSGETGTNDAAGCSYAVSYFDVIVVPELLIWRPTISNEWGNDANWHGIVNGKEMTWGFAPLSTSSVIIPTMDNELLYPVVTGENLYPMSFGYEPASCDNIYMEAGAHILGQEKLKYNKAYVDMPIEHSHWNAVASPMRKMYSGDFFVPHNPNTWAESTQENKVYTLDGNDVNGLRAGHTGILANNATLFDAALYQGSRSSSAPYAFWVNYYNREVNTYLKNTTDNAETVTHTASATFAPSNAVNNLIEPGQGVEVLGYGPWGDGEKQTLTVRLPKRDESYNYYMYGDVSDGDNHTTSRDADFYKFAWKSDNNHPERMTVTLTNGSAELSSQFMLGNPTMAYVDLHKFMNANKDVLTGDFGYKHNETWEGVTYDILDISGHRFLAPMEAILVQARNKQASIQVVFVDSMMTLDDMRFVASAPAHAPASAPGRANANAAAAAAADEAPLQLMTITAFTDDMEAIAYLGKKTDALNGYRAGEDAFFISSGVEDGTENDYSTLTTPLNIYTVSDSTALMVDLRPGITMVPLHFLTHADYRTDSVNLICNMNMDWSTPCYLIDSVAGTREPIMNGYVMKIQLPGNHQSRYYIEGPDPYIKDVPNQPNNPGLSTGIEAAEAVEEDLTGYPVEKLLINGHLYLQRGPALYNATGKRLR